jgi:phosphate transport system substrate-binding protein
VKNQAGSFVEPSLASVTAAASSARFEKNTDFRVSITDAPGDQAYPISSFTWLLVRPDARDPAKGKAFKDFLAWMITPEAQKMAEELKYAALPAPVISLIEARLPTLKAGGKAIAAR